MNSTTYDVAAHASPHVESTYTAQQIADAHNVKSVTVRTRWFKWLEKVAPAQLLKHGDRFTELAHTLFAEFAQVDKKERPAWVADAKQRYASEWNTVGIIDCEVMPAEVGSTLATLTSRLELSQQNFALELADVTDFIDQLNAVDANISQAEVASWAAAGQMKAVAQFKTEEVAKQQTLNALRQQRLQGSKKS
ncbi:MAG: hypothetical protein AAGC93_16675 [Cyanobacteria bacterium P01_F01_bin.53]